MKNVVANAAYRIDLDKVLVIIRSSLGSMNNLKLTPHLIFHNLARMSISKLQNNLISSRF